MRIPPIGQNPHPTTTQEQQLILGVEDEAARVLRVEQLFDEQVWVERNSGLSLREVAGLHSVSVSAVRSAERRMVKRLAPDVSDREALRDQTASKMDQRMLELERRMVHPDVTDRNLVALSRLYLRYQESRAKLLGFASLVAVDAGLADVDVADVAERVAVFFGAAAREAREMLAVDAAERQQIEYVDAEIVEDDDGGGSGDV